MCLWVTHTASHVVASFVWTNVHAVANNLANLFYTAATSTERVTNGARFESHCKIAFRGPSIQELQPAAVEPYFQVWMWQPMIGRHSDFHASNSSRSGTVWTAQLRLLIGSDEN